MEIHLEDESSRLFLMDILSCGRAVSGERFAYRRFSSKVMIWRGAELIYRDNCRYEPERMTMEGLGMYEGFSHMANIFLTVPSAGGGSGRVLLGEIRTLLEDAADCEGGVTCLASGDLAVRILGNRAQKLQEVAEQIKKCWESK
jgi:urease accessory protein